MVLSCVMLDISSNRKYTLYFSLQQNSLTPGRRLGLE